MEPAPASETTSPPRRNGKSASAFRTISEVANELELPQHVLRFWETKFQNVRPLKRGGGRRYYRPEDVTLLRQIRDLLYNDGYTIKGVQKLFRESGGKPSSAAQTAQAAQSQPPGRTSIRCFRQRCTDRTSHGFERVRRSSRYIEGVLIVACLGRCTVITAGLYCAH